MELREGQSRVILEVEKKKKKKKEKREKAFIMLCCLVGLRSE